jgi:pyochelin biosynthesis protein PchC
VAGSAGSCCWDQYAVYTLVENCRAEAGRSVACPVIVLVGDQDPLVNLDEATVWKEHTRAGLELESFAGGHFYLTAHVPALARTVTGRLAPGG